MWKLLKTTAAGLAAAAVVASTAPAHEAGKGANGGPQVDAGKYHAELVLDGSSKVTLYLTDHDAKPVRTAGFKANAIFVVDGKPLRFALEPAEDIKLVGTAPIPVPAGVKGAVQLTAPDGATAQAKF